MPAVRTTTRPRPPVDGSIPALVGHTDWQAQHNASEAFVVFPSPADAQEIMSISYAEFAKATHRVAHIIRPNVSGGGGEVIALLLNIDTIMYQAIMVGLIRAGYKPFPMSPRNTAEAVYHLMKSTHSHSIMSHASLRALASGITSLAEKDSYHIDFVECPSLQDIYPTVAAKTNQTPETSPFVPYPGRNKLYAPEDIVYYLHSSGSTGLPKPIPHTERRSLEWVAAMASRGDLTHVISACPGLPTFHAMGVGLQLYSPLAGSQTVAVFTPQSPAPPTIPNTHNTLEIVRTTRCQVLPTIPAFLEAWSHSPEALELLASMIVVFFGGGPIAKATGDKLISHGVNIRSIYGATEIAGCCLMFEDGDPMTPIPDWEWLKFADSLDIRWVPQGDGTFELQILTNDHFHPAVENLPDVRGYSTKDLFIPHPTNPKLWKIVGRLDDVIVLGSAEKIVPIAQEGFLQSVPFVNGAVMFGRARNQPGILLELTPEHAFDPKDHNALAKFRNRVWPYVEEANKLGPQFARIFKEMILVTSPDKPFLRAAKGTVQRRAIYNQYAQEIDDLYDTVEESSDAHGVSAPESWSPDAVEEWLAEHATAISEGRALSRSADLFEQGFDSLSATFLRNRILGAFRSSPDPFVQAAAATVPDDVIFANPTIQWLASVVAGLADPVSSAVSVKSNAAQIEEMVAKYTKDLPAVTGKKPLSPSQGLVVVLTGSTGGLGSHLLADLLANENVRKVVTLDRAEHIQDRQQIAFQDRLLPLHLLKSDKLLALTVSTTRADLGLSEDILHEIKSSLTHVIHNAWKVDFNMALSSFESNVAYTRRLIDVTASCANAVRFFFTSSVSAAMGWDVARGPVPEEVIQSPDTAGRLGYGSSKYVTERVVFEAARRGLPAMSIRIGQIAGATNTGAWNISDWVPIIIKSSLSIGALPIYNEDLSWLPMDVTSQTIIDALFTCSQVTPPELINLVHPRTVPGQSIFEAMRSAIGRDNLKFISFDEWLEKLEKLAANATEQDLQKTPALKTMDFFRRSRPGHRVLTFDTTKAQGLSEALRKAKPLGREDAARWIAYWKNKGMLD